MAVVEALHTLLGQDAAERHWNFTRAVVDALHTLLGGSVAGWTYSLARGIVDASHARVGLCIAGIVAARGIVDARDALVRLRVARRVNSCSASTVINALHTAIHLRIAHLIATIAIHQARHATVRLRIAHRQGCVGAIVVGAARKARPLHRIAKIAKGAVAMGIVAAKNAPRPLVRDLWVAVGQLRRAVGVGGAGEGRRGVGSASEYNQTQPRHTKMSPGGSVCVASSRGSALLNESRDQLRPRERTHLEREIQTGNHRPTTPDVSITPGTAEPATAGRVRRPPRA